MIRTVQYFKDKFIVGYKITQQDYADWLDSFIHASSGISVANITDLSATLANYRLKNVNIPASEITGLAAAISAQTTNFLTSSSSVSISQVTGLVVALSNCTTVAQVQQMIDDALSSFSGGETPHIGSNGNWFIGDTDTGVGAQGPTGANGADGLQGVQGIQGVPGTNGTNGADGVDGADGSTPTIGSNGNWLIDGVDTGKPATKLKIEFKIGDGGENTPIAGTTEYHNSLLAGLTDMTIFRNGSPIFRNAGIEFIDTGGFSLTTPDDVFSNDPMPEEWIIEVGGVVTSGASLPPVLQYEEAATFADISLTGEKRLIRVLVDETSASNEELYFFNGTSLRWIPTEAV